MKSLHQPKDAEELEKLLTFYPRIFIDLDHTIYDRFDYDFFVFKDMAVKICGFNEERSIEAAVSLWNLKEENGPHYRSLFNDFLDLNGLNPSLLHDLVNYYQAYEPNMLFPAHSLQPMLLRLKKAGHQIVIVTNGEKYRQQRKIEALDMSSVADHIFILDPYDKTLEMKPDPSVIKEFESLRGKEHAVIVGDDLETDGQLARNAGLEFIHYEHTGAQRRNFLPNNRI